MRKHLTQDDLAAAAANNLRQLAQEAKIDPADAGLSGGAISKIEGGQTRNPTIISLVGIVSVLESSLDEILEEAGLLSGFIAPDYISPEEWRLLNVIRSSPTPSFRRKLLQTITDLAIVARDADQGRIVGETG